MRIFHFIFTIFLLGIVFNGNLNAHESEYADISINENNCFISHKRDKIYVNPQAIIIKDNNLYLNVDNKLMMISGLFSDSKRPVTKRLLQRIDLRAVLERVSHNDLLFAAQEELQKLGLQWNTSIDNNNLDFADWLFGRAAESSQGQQIALLSSTS